MSEGNLNRLMCAAHTMKGMLRNLSMNRAAEIACALEAAAHQGEKAQAEALLPQLEEAIAELMPEVEARLEKVKA